MLIQEYLQFRDIATIANAVHDVKHPVQLFKKATHSSSQSALHSVYSSGHILCLQALLTHKKTEFLFIICKIVKYVDPSVFIFMKLLDKQMTMKQRKV